MIIKIIKIICVVFIYIEMFINAPYVKALSVSTNISEKYAEIQSGERLYFEINIKYPENPQRKDLRLNYEVIKDGEIIAQSQVLKAVETQAQFLDFIVIPESSTTGLYNLKIKISDYENLTEEVATSFKVVAGVDKELKIYFFILLGVAGLVAILAIINIIVFRRKK
jgi:hypothetical protein